jgi:LCP family protein required for cell wall assembly
VFVGPADQDPRPRGPQEPPGAHSIFAAEPSPASAGYGGYEPPPLDPDEVGKPRRNWKQRMLLGLGVVVVLSCLVGVLGGFWAIRTWNSIGRVDGLELNAAEAGDPKNYLIVGSDSRSGENEEYGATGGQRSDSIMVLRIDPQSEQAVVLSFPRDLQVEIPGLGVNKINAAYSGESANPQRLIETLRENFGIPIHHYVEIDFAGFKNLVDHVGGIELWFDEAVRNPPGGDYDVGLWIPEQGCVTVDGTQALALARTRLLEHRAPDGWELDPTSDYGRMTRQQIVIRQALKKAVAQAKSSPLELKGLLELASKTVNLDKVMSLDDMLDLADRFKDFDPNKLLTYSLPTYTQDTAGKGNPYPEKQAAEPILNVFRGLPVNEVGPSLISLKVWNGSGKEGQAANVGGALQKIGFEQRTPESWTGDPVAATTVFHAPGQEAYGLRIARHITGGAEVKVDPELSAGEVDLVTGPNFTTIHEDPTPIDKLPSPTTQAPGNTATTGATTTTTAAPAGGASPTTTAAPPPPTEQKGYAAGQPPPGQTCG